MKMNPVIKYRYAFFLPILLGFLQGAAYDFSHLDNPFIPAFFSALSLSGFLLLIAQLPIKKSALYGYLFGLSTFSWGLDWIYISLARFGGASLFTAIFANVLVVMFLAIYWALIAYTIAKLGKNRHARLGLAIAIIPLLEWLRSVFLIGFPWLSIGYAWVGLPVARYASLGGIFFLGQVIILGLVLPLCRATVRQRLLFIGLSISLFFIWPYFLKPTEKSQQQATVALIQGNRPVITEYSRRRIAQNLRIYQHLTTQLVNRQSVNTVIWPEAAMPYYYDEYKDFLAKMQQLQQKKYFDLMTGIPRANWDKNEVFNAFLLQKRKEGLMTPAPQFYDKRHLLPFGEYLPFRSFFQFFKSWVDIPMSDFSRGKAVQKPFFSAGINYAPSICFEVVFGDEIRKNALQAAALLNVSNDAWFGQSKAQIQHANIARMRAVENQKMLVRATNNGKTLIVNRDGKVINALPAFEQGVLVGKVSAYHHQTLYARFGDKLVIISSALCLFIQLFFYGSKRKQIATASIRRR